MVPTWRTKRPLYIWPRLQPGTSRIQNKTRHEIKLQLVTQFFEREHVGKHTISVLVTKGSTGLLSFGCSSYGSNQIACFYVLLTVQLSIILDNDQLDTHLFYITICLLKPSTCFEHYMLIIRRLNCTEFSLNLYTGRLLTESATS